VDVTLRTVTRSNVRAIRELRLADRQHHLVAPAAFTVAEGNYEPNAILRAIYADEEPVGVLLVETETLNAHLARFMIDAARQRHGIGRRAVGLLADELRSAGWPALETSFVPVKEGAEGFWKRCGFIDTGHINHEGEPIWILDLTP
jgi:diamine N-acetyltransferase